MSIRRALVLACFCVPVLASVEANASEDNAAVEACKSKSKGDACSYQKPHKEDGKPLTHVDQAGTCQDDECCELDYSKGSPPTSNCGPCLACKPGGTGNSAATAKTGPNQENPRTGDDPPAPASGKRTCSIGGEGAPVWAVLLLLLAATRRR